MRSFASRRHFVKTSIGGFLAGLLVNPLPHRKSTTEAAESTTSAFVNGEKEIALPEPVKTGGAPLIETLASRKSERSFHGNPLDLQTISNLLWAANGINRPDGRRTVPSPMNAQETELYLIFEKGTYRHDVKENRLHLVAKGDHRDLAGVQPYTHDAPMTILFVADFEKLDFASEEERPVYAAVDAGFIGQNVYLFAVSNGLNAVFRGSIERKKIAERFHLSKSQSVSFAQSVG